MTAVDVKTAIMALARLTGDAEDKKLLGQFIAETHVATAPKNNTGLPCEYCSEPQRRLVLERVQQVSGTTDDKEDRILIRIASIEDEKGAVGLSRLIARFAKGGA